MCGNASALFLIGSAHPPPTCFPFSFQAAVGVPAVVCCAVCASLQVGSVDDNRSGGGYAYRASKSALNIVNKSMSIDLAGDGITSVLLHPGKGERR